ncbi:MAG TPA: methyltransferase domain-containing protein [Mycobacterium sp.]|nr:methyltransferase domain-containing protein [Mycobacterium sp.]
MGRWSRRLAPLFLAFAEVGEGCVVLDVGCGTGALAWAAAEIPSVNVTGVDPCEAYIRSAQERAAGYPVRFEVGDAQALPYPDATFDRALSMLMLNFLAKPVTAVHEMIRVTRSNGVVAAAVWDYGDGMEMLRTFWDEAVALIPDAASHDERHMPLSRRGELTELWRAQQLRDVHEQPLTIESVFSSFDDYWQPFRAGQGPAGSFTVALSESQRQVLKSRLRDRLLDSGPDRPFTLSTRAWAVRGVVV